MDFGQFTAKDRHEEGSWLHLTHPFNGAPLYLSDGNTITTEESDAPCEVLVRGNRAPKVKACMDAKKRADELHAMKLMRASEREQESLATQRQKDQAEHEISLLVATVADWRNIVIKEGDDPAPCTAENVVKALNHPHFMVAIFKRSADEGALFTTAPTG